MTMNRTSLRRFFLLVVLIASPIAPVAANQPLEATTEDGRKVILHPDGRWEFGTPGEAGAPAANKAATPQASAPVAGGTAGATARPDDRYCQGGLFGVGRRICPGDPEYNRGSLNPKLR
ncbi:MAG: hypothetical protein ABW205_05435 [Burkholderiales bacterium]